MKLSYGLLRLVISTLILYTVSLFVMGCTINLGPRLPFAYQTGVGSAGGGVILARQGIPIGVQQPFVVGQPFVQPQFAAPVFDQRGVTDGTQQGPVMIQRATGQRVYSRTTGCDYAPGGCDLVFTGSEGPVDTYTGFRTTVGVTTAPNGQTVPVLVPQFYQKTGPAPLRPLLRDNCGGDC